MDIIPPPVLSIILAFFVVLSLSAHAVHSQELTQCSTSPSQSFLSVFYLFPPFKAHTVQQHLPLCLFNLLSLFDIWAEKYFFSFQSVCEHCGFPGIPFDPFHLYDINLLWWCLFFGSKLNRFQILVAWSHFPGFVCSDRLKGLHHKYPACAYFAHFKFSLHAPWRSQTSGLGTEDQLCHSCQSPCSSAFRQKACSQL